MRTDIDRAWVRRPLVSPAPWGESLPDVWLETELNFYRRTDTTQNRIGGFAGSGVPNNYLIINGHAEVAERTGLSIGGEQPGGGTIVRRHYNIFIPVPGDTGLLPRAGDRVWFYDGLGRRIDVALEYVTPPEGIRDHIEISTAEFE